MTKEEYIDFANALKNNYTIDFDKLPEFCDMAISALSENKGNEVAEVIEGVLDKIAGVPYHFWDSEAVVYLADVISAVEDCKKGGEA